MEPNESTLAPSLGDVRPGRTGPARVPGLIHVFTGGVPAARPLRVSDGLDLGRGNETLGPLRDGRVSRTHARVRRDGQRLVVTDLGSQNGTWVDGAELPSGSSRELARVLRIGDSLFVPCADVGPLEARGVVVQGGFVRGPAMQELLDEVAQAGRLSPSLHIHGESGAGKEGVAQAFHDAGERRGGPFVAVNCASIPAALAERLLFGARKGAYSGADADAPGYFVSADGGTLFLDEVVELEPAVQAKLLRVLETRDVVPLGASAARRVDVRVVSASARELRGLVGAGRLREDLFFRIAQPEARLPPLRQRPEEIAHLLLRAAGDLALHAGFVEACLLRPWPGNVRELLAETRAAAQKALLAGDGRLEAAHLRPSAGTAFGAAEPAAAAPPVAQVETRPSRPIDDETRARIVEALQRSGGNIAGAARSLGLHRTQLRRLLERHQIAVEPDDSAEGSGPAPGSDGA